MTTEVCPIVSTINSIRDGGLYNDDSDASNVVSVFEGRVIVNGGGSNCEYVCDDASYYLNMRLLSAARLLNSFRVGESSLDNAPIAINSLFKDQIGRTYVEIFYKIIDTGDVQRHVHNVYNRFLELMSDIDDLVKINISIISEKNFAVSLPELILLPNITYKSIYDNEVLYNAMCKIREYVNSINVTLITGLKKVSINEIPKPTQLDPLPDKKFEVAVSEATDYTTYKKIVDNALQIERQIVNRVLAHNKYQCIIINIINKLFFDMSRGFSQE